MHEEAGPNAWEQGDQAAIRAERRAAFRRSTWPRREGGSRLSGGCNPILQPKFRLSRDQAFFAIGSCFARNIEEYLARAGLRIISRELRFPISELKSNSRPNDLLFKYTPGSILDEVRSALDSSYADPGERALIAASEDDEYFDGYLPFQYNPVSRARALARRNEVRALYQNLAGCDVLIVTLGLIEHWYDRHAGIYVNDTPPASILARHPGRFEFRQLDYTANRDLVEATIDLVKARNPAIKIILTTSPVPLHQTATGQDVIVANAYSKSILRTVAQEMAGKFDFIDYFPSYEMVTLAPPEIAWENDLRHVRDALVGTIMGRFFEAYVPDLEEAKIDLTSRFADARALLDAGQGADALAAMAELEAQLGDDKAFLAPYALAAILADDAAQADRITAIMLRKQPGDWADIMRARAMISAGRHEEALRHLRSAGRQEATLLHAGGWEMEVGRLTRDVSVELSGALRAAQAIANEWGSPSKKPWITKRMLAILEREGRREELAAVQSVIESR